MERARIVTMLAAVAARLPLVVPLHPRGQAGFVEAGLRATPALRIIDPLGYVAFLSLVRGAAVVITDSGGIQEETTILGVPCLTVRPNTERPITISQGTNRLVTPEAVDGSVASILAAEQPAAKEPPPGWDGRAGDRIAEIVAEWLSLRA